MTGHRTVVIPYADGPKGTCKWCGEPIRHGRSDRRWHDGREDEPNCIHEYRMASDHDYIRAIARREGWHFCAVCGLPGPGLHGPMVGYRLDHSLSSVVADTLAEIGGFAAWELRPLAAAINRRIGWSRWGFTLQVDHIHPLIDGGSFHPSNLQLLCPDHHKAKTAREATLRARGRREAAAGQTTFDLTQEAA